MWINFEVIQSNHEVIYLPYVIAQKYKDLCLISFGGKSSWAKVQTYNYSEEYESNSFINPIHIKISQKLCDELLIPITLTYRINLLRNRIIIGPVIGFLLGNHSHRYNTKHMEKYSDRFGIYDKIGGLICAFSPKTINWEKKIVYGLYFNNSQNAWQYGCVPLPTVIYRRNFHTDPQTIKLLIDFTNNKLFNSYRFSKVELFQVLNDDSVLALFLPPTELTRNYEQIKEFIDKHKKIILKPVDLSRGRGICIIEKIASSYKITDYRNKENIEHLVSNDKALENFFRKNNSFFNKYIVQKYLNLAKIDNSFFDIRIVMQKKSKSNWKCTGIECRVGRENSLVTNISRGGFALELDSALRKSFPENCDYDFLSQQIHDLSFRICNCLDKMKEHFAEFGLDIAIDQNQKLWIIETNVFPSFKGFKEMDYETYLNIRYTPLLYALSLTEFNDSNN